MEIELLAWVMVRDGQGRVLLGRRAGTGLAEGLWNLPGGHVEPGESVAQAGARETAEEVGVLVRVVDDDLLDKVVGRERFAHGLPTLGEELAGEVPTPALRETTNRTQHRGREARGGVRFRCH